MKAKITLILLIIMGSIYGVQAQSFDFSCETCIMLESNFTSCDVEILIANGFNDLDPGFNAFFGRYHTFPDGFQEEVIIAYDSVEPGHYRIGSATRITQISVATLAEALAILDDY